MNNIKEILIKNKVKIFTIATAGITGIFATWFYFTPHLTLYGMQQAAERQDAQELSKHIDFSSLKASVKIELQQQLAKKLQKELQAGNPFAGLSIALTQQCIDSAVDAYITPESLAAIMQGRSPESQSSDTQQQGFRQEKSKSETKISMKYKSYNSFVVHIEDKNKGTDTLNLVFSRDGLANWKLSALDLPDLTL